MSIKEDIDYSLPCPAAGTYINNKAELIKFFADRDNKQVVVSKTNEIGEIMSETKCINMSGLHCLVSHSFVVSFMLGHNQLDKKCPYTFFFDDVFRGEVFRATAQYRKV